MSLFFFKVINTICVLDKNVNISFNLVDPTFENQQKEINEMKMKSDDYSLMGSNVEFISKYNIKSLEKGGTSKYYQHK